MPFEQKENTGSLFPNDRKESERHADFTGKLNVNGQLYWLNMWDNDTAGGRGPRFKLTIRPVKPRAGGRVPGSSERPTF